MKKLISIISGLIASTMLVTVVYGGDVSGTNFAQTIVVISSTSVSQEVDASNISTQTLFDLSYINSSSMNMDLHEAAADVPFMPGSKNVNVLYAWNNAGTEETTQATNSTSSDMTLPALDTEVYEFAFDHASRFLKLNVSLPLVGTGITVTWEYYNGSWFALSNVLDNTVAFSVTGTNSVSWDIPATWTRQSLHSQLGFWIRARLTAASVSGSPAGTRAWYETGRMFYYIDTISSIDQLNYDLYMGGPNIRTYHSYFPGADGIQTPDDATMEPSSGSSASEWKFDINNAFRLDTNESGYVFSKPSSMYLDYINTAVAGGDNTLTFSTTGANFYGEWTHNEEDGEGYYNNASQESYSKALYNASSNYITAREENDADILSNTSSEVTSHKVGQAYDKVIDTTPAFGAKLNDPS